MEEIDYKLLSSNPVLISHAISKLLEQIKIKVENEQNKDISQIPEYKALLSKYKKNSPLLCSSISQAIIFLAKNRILTTTSALSTFASCLSTTNNYAPIVVAMRHLLLMELQLQTHQNAYVCPYTLESHPHPFIMVFNQDRHAWQPVLKQMRSIINHHDEKLIENGVQMLRPVFLYILCNPSEHFSSDCKQQLWNLLIESDNTPELQAEILLWLLRKPINICLNTNDNVMELAKISLFKHNDELCVALLPLLTSLTIKLLEHGYDPKENFDTLSIMAERCDNEAINITIGLLADIILICPSAYLFDAFKLCIRIIESKSCSIVFLNALVASILKWMMYPSLLCSDALILARDLLNKILEGKWQHKITMTNLPKTLLTLSQSDADIGFYIEILRCTSDWSKTNALDWLESVSAAPIDLRYKCRLIICGLFVQSTDTDTDTIKATCDILVQLAREVTTFASHVLPLILYKLSKVSDTDAIKLLLLAIPELTVAKENVPIVIQTIEIFINSDNHLKWFAVELYIKALDKVPRCYRFLSTAISRMTKNDRSWYSDAVCAKAMMRVCECRPEHGEELVPLLSHVLNHCTDTNGGTASAFAIKSISALCKSAVIGICSTWKGLSPMIRKEKRTIVLESVCEFLGGIPHCPYRASDEHDKLIIDVLAMLWQYATSSDLRVAGAALKALKSYRLQQVPLKILPAQFKCNIAIPSAYKKNAPADVERSPDDVLPYIPGTCWIQMLQKVHKSVLPLAGDFLIHHVKNELSTFRSGIYIWPQGEPNDYKYLPDHSVIRTVGEYLRRSTPDSENSRIVTECLRIFAHEYQKPLPNVKWSFLQKTMNLSEEAKEYTLLIASNHATISLSAKTFIEEYLSAYATEASAMPLIQSGEYLILYSNLDRLCEVLQQQDLKPFLELTLDHVLGKMEIQQEESTKLFEKIMLAYAGALKNEAIHNSNHTLLSSILEKLLDRIDLSRDKFSPYVKALANLSLKEIERLTSPSVWWEVTPEKLRNAITVRTELILDNDTSTPLAWMNDTIDTVLSAPEAQTYLLERIQKMQRAMRLEKTGEIWVGELIQRIQSLMADDSEQNTQKIALYCDIFFISIICLSAVDCLLVEKHVLITSQDVRIRLFPQAVITVADRAFWKDTLVQLMDWLDYMRTSSIPKPYKNAFESALISLRHESHFSKAWKKYLSVKTSIQL